MDKRQGADTVRVRDALNGILAALQTFVPVIAKAGLTYEDLNEVIGPYGYTVHAK
jgi:hypothetical protein